MGMSDERRKQRAKRKAAKEARMRGEKPKSTSKYALKRRGIYQPSSPYLTGNWGQRMKRLRDIPEIAPVAARPSAEFLLARDRAETWGR